MLTPGPTMPMLRDQTIAIVLDKQHALEFSQVVPGWLRWHPELAECRWLFVLSEPSARRTVCRTLKRHFTPLLDHPDQVQAVEGYRSDLLPPASLASSHHSIAFWHYLVTVPELVQTSRWTKIDTDVVALADSTTDSDWLAWGDDSLVTGLAWDTTKPAGVLPQYMAWVARHWSNTTPVAYEPLEDRDVCPRLVGWLSSHDTPFTREIAQVCRQSPPPVVSHDTLTWLVAEMTGRRWQSLEYESAGWEHCRPWRIRRQLRSIERKPALTWLRHRFVG